MGVIVAADNDEPDRVIVKKLEAAGFKKFRLPRPEKLVRLVFDVQDQDLIWKKYEDLMWVNNKMSRRVFYSAVYMYIP